MRFSLRPRRFGAAALALICASTLSGCDSVSNFYRDAVELRIDATGGVEMVICDSALVGRGEGFIRDGATGDWSTFWRAEGHAPLQVGDIGKFGAVPFGLSATVDIVPDIRAGDEVNVFLYDATDGSRSDISGIFVVSDLTAAEGKWITSDGELHSEACEP